MTTLMEFYISKKDRKETKKKLKEFFSEDVIDIIEEGFYDFTEQFCCNNKNNLLTATAIYKDHFKNFMFNCNKNENNKTINNLIKKINKNKYNAYNLAFLRPEELDEENWMRIILRRKTTEETLKNLPSIEWKPCKLCKSKEHYFYQLQTRSADEATTTFYICKTCGKTNKINN